MQLKLISLLIMIIIPFSISNCSKHKLPESFSSKYPVAVNFEKVGSYPAFSDSGGGYFYDEVLEYRVWIHPDRDDYFQAFPTYEDAFEFSKKTNGAEDPLVLILQYEHINEPVPGKFEHVKGDRITEWQVQWLEGNKRKKDSISIFLKAKSK